MIGKCLIFVAAFAVFAGCVQPAANNVPAEETEVYRISLNDNNGITVNACTSVEFHDPVFVPPADITVTVTNEWDRETGRLNVTLGGSDADIFSVSPARINSLAPGGSAVITVRISPTDPRRSVSYTVDLLVGNENVYRKIPITYQVEICTEPMANTGVHQ
ncbi:MAG: hypothetical protein FWF29_05890 [Treponema sp.]|nr:hypothetical protein [Treponema sp.]